MHLQEFLEIAVARRASDIHLKAGTPPMLRIDGKIVPSELRVLTASDTKQALYSILTNEQKIRFEKEMELDFSFTIEDLARFRVNVYREQGNIGAVFRVIPIDILSIDALALPEVTKKLALERQGLILVTGVTGSGKSTTLAAMIDHINNNEYDHVVTIEDPLEFVHGNKKSILTQREIGNDTQNFALGLRAALREDPDVILIGEMRDAETIDAAIKAAETGHLVFSTLHTTDAVQTINRIINVFPLEHQDQVRFQLANVLRATIAQRLIPRSDGLGRVGVFEIFVNTPTAKDLILRKEMEELYKVILEGAFDGMCSMNMSLLSLYQSGAITAEAALAYSDTPNELEQMMRGAFHGGRVR